MADNEQLETILADLLDVLYLQAKGMEKLFARVEQVTPCLPEVNEVSVVRSELAALQVRMRKLQAIAPSSREQSLVGQTVSSTDLQKYKTFGSS